MLIDPGVCRKLARIRFHSRPRRQVPALIEEILGEVRITTVLTGVRMPRMNPITERWVKKLRAELLDRVLIRNETTCGTRFASTSAITTCTELKPIGHADQPLPAKPNRLSGLSSTACDG